MQSIVARCMVTLRANERIPLRATRLVYKRTDGNWAWQLTSSNGQVIATDGGQGYEGETDARSMADRIISGEFKNAEKKVRR